jgi:hypothetical protein
MEHRMPGFWTGLSGRPHSVAALTFLALLFGTAGALLFGTAGALAQNAGPDETVNADGAVSRQLGLTETQKTAIYDAVSRQHVRSAAWIPGAVLAAVGAPVSPATELAALPGQAAAIASVDDRPEKDLKYAMVEDDLVVVDPVKMRVVEVIHGNTRH